MLFSAVKDTESDFSNVLNSSAVLYLNNNFTGGQFVFARKDQTVEVYQVSYRRITTYPYWKSRETN